MSRQVLDEIGDTSCSSAWFTFATLEATTSRCVGHIYKLRLPNR